MQRTRIIILAVVLPALIGAAAPGQDAPGGGQSPVTGPAAEPPLAPAAEPPLAPAAEPPLAPAAEPRVAPAAEPPPVRELAPELYYLKDESGRLVPVPGFGYSDFLEMFRIKEGLGGPALPPPAILESVVVRIDARGLSDVTTTTGAQPSGPAGDRRTACPVEVSIRVRQSRRGWAMVPLGLGRVLLDGPPRHEGPGRMLVDADPEGGGYRCWFESPPDAGIDLQHVVTLDGRLPVAGGAGREVFEIRLPAAVASRVELRTARSQPAVDVVPATARVDASAAEEGSLVTITGLAGETRIRLGSAATAATTSVATDAACQSVVRIDGRSARTTATLEVKNLPPGTRQLRIRLPAGTTLESVAGAGSLPQTRGDGPDETAPDTVTVAVDPRPDGSAVIELACERPVDSSGKATLDPVGFAVAGIEPWRQRGRISLVIEGDWQATWDDVPGVRRIDPPADEREPGLTAAFAYDSQPASLPLRIRPRRSRVVIEPEYRYVVSAARITLAARLRVAVRGAPVGSLVLGLDSAWSLAEVGPVGVVDSAGVRNEAGRVTIPFLQPLAGDAVVEIEAARDIDPTADGVAWSLPVPRADLVGPAAVVIASDSEIELLPDVAATVGLVRQTSSTLRPGDSDGVALAYRLDAPEGRFAATRKFLPRRVEAVVAARVAVDEREITVSETIRLDVLHVPLEFLELTLPEAVLESGSLEIRQQGELLSGLDVSPLDETDPADRPLVVARVFLPRPLLGRGEVVVSYREATPTIPAAATAAVDLALPLPAAAGTIRQSVVIEDSPALVIVPRGDSWRREFTGVAGGGRSWSSAKPRSMLPLAISARTREAAGVTVIEAAWLRTRLFPTSREDLATFVVLPADDQLQIRLPAAATAVTVEARLDGSPVPLEPDGDGSYTLDIAPPGRGSRLVEIRTVSAWGGTWFGLGLPWPLPLDAPAFAEGVIQRRFCWEVGLLPGDDLAGMPARWTSQQHWLWDGFGWKQQPTVASAELADWIAETLGRPAVAVTAPDWPVQERRSVAVGLGPPGTAVAWVIPTWFTVLVASGTALAIGLAMVFVPVWRRPPVVVGLLAAAAVGWAAVPTLGPLVAQAAAPGAGLAALAALLQRLNGPTPTRRAGQPVGSASSLTRSAVPAVSLIVSSPEPGSTASARSSAS
jgi:hypothetical protein